MDKPIGLLTVTLGVALFGLYYTLKDINKGLVWSLSVYIHKPVSFKKSPIQASLILFFQLLFCVAYLVVYVILVFGDWQ